MKAARLHAYHDALKLDSIDEPKVDRAARRDRADRRRRAVPDRPAHPGGAVGARSRRSCCPTRPGHENAGWVHEIGSGVTNVAVGDTVIVHPFISCGLCGPCRRGDDMHCLNGSFPGINRDGGFADFLQTSARSVVKLEPGLEPKDIAALADAGPDRDPRGQEGDAGARSRARRAVVIGAGGLGHIGIQCLKAYDAGRDHRDRPVREGAGAGRRDGRRSHRQGRRPSTSTRSRS